MFKKIPINYLSAIIIFVIVIAWIFSGSFSSNDDVAQVSDDIVVEELISVRAKNFNALDKTYFLTIRGRAEADKVVLLKPKTSSTIVYTIEKGSFVKKDELICELDPENRIAALNEANASKNKAQLQYDAIKTLSEEGYRSDNSVATAEAALKASIARVEMAINELDNVKIRSPFDGFVEDVYLELGDLITPASPCAKVMKLNPMIITGEVTEKNVDQINLEKKVTINFLDKSSITGKISFISKSANPSTRTYKIEATVDNKKGIIREGLSADMLVPISRVQAHLIPSYLISLNDAGDLGVKILNDTKVLFSDIEIIEDTIEGLWVTGLPKNSTIITVGQEYVVNNQNVEVELVE
ncbi:efflux RND transporter periplasmic adaptor subunit [Pelagibacteraceae bacterium]|nr:efflux RND transporter periplasmic adaptor subunit [Pelagibacteraceae bacterium]